MTKNALVVEFGEAAAVEAVGQDVSRAAVGKEMAHVEAWVRKGGPGVARWMEKKCCCSVRGMCRGPGSVILSPV